MSNLRVGVIGAVGSTAITLKLLYKHEFNVVGVLGHEPVVRERVSGLYDLRSLAVSLNIPFAGFQKIHDSVHLAWMREKQPDIIFAVGFSQLLSDDWLKLPKLGCIGFHPTLLPKGRGRAPLAWLVLEERKGAASFFLMGKGTDDGPVFIQEPFVLQTNDDAQSTSVIIDEAINKALDKWLPKLKQGIWEPIPQDESQATWYGRRSPEDGLINWYNKAEAIDRLIKGSTKPHPGAYTYFKHVKIIIWSSELEISIPIKGVVGRVLVKQNSKGYLIQCGEGLIWIKDIILPLGIELKGGDKLGYQLEDEIYNIWAELRKLKKNE